jgi:hypothetical protein
MNILMQFVEAHRTVILLAGAWNFSAVLSAMPELPENAPFWAVWAHDYLQIVAANLNKRGNPKP